MTHSPSPHEPRPDDLPLHGAGEGSARNPGDAQLLAQLDKALAPTQAPAGLVDAVLHATCDHLPATQTEADARLLRQLDRALAAGSPPAGLIGAVLDATRGGGGAAARDAAAQLDKVLAPSDAPSGLIDAVLDATRGHLPAPAPVGRIGFDRVVWTRAFAAAALVTFAAGVWWFGPAGEGAAVKPAVAIHGTPAGPIQTAEVGGGEPDFDSDAARLLEPFETIDSQLAHVASSGDAATGPVGLLGQRLAAVAEADLWSGSGLDGIDRAIDWEVSFETADDGAWLF